MVAKRQLFWLISIGYVELFALWRDTKTLMLVSEFEFASCYRNHYKAANTKKEIYAK